MAKTLFVSNDDIENNEIVRILRQDQHQVEGARAHALTGPEQFDTTSYELIVFDFSVEAERVLEGCRRIRSSNVMVPIVVVTGDDNTEYESALLDAGVSDCLLNTFCSTELLSRVQTLQLRFQQGMPGVLKIQDVELDCQALRVTRAGSEIPLTRKEFEILNLLMHYPNKSFTPETILKRVWDSSSSSTVATVRTHMKTLRRKMGDNCDQQLIKTTRGWGYKVVDGANSVNLS